MPKTIVIAGATGNLGSKVIASLLKEDVIIKALVRKETKAEALQVLKALNVEIVEVDYNNQTSLVEACKNAFCVLSTLSGLFDVVVETQQKLIDAAEIAKAQKFIASDFSSDYRNLVPGQNRNLDFRKVFYDYANTKSIKVTSIFNGAFMDLLKTDMPLILKKQKRILCWGNKLQKMEFTHTNDVALFTAQACIAENTPRNLFIAGDVLHCQNFVDIMSQIENTEYKIFKPGGIGLLNIIIKLTKFFAPAKNELYPAWQGMQYMRDMMEGRIEIKTNYDNNLFEQTPFLTADTFLKH